MSFAQEMKDFVGGWTAVREMGFKKDGVDLQKQQIEDLKAYRDATLALDEQKMAQQDRQFNMNYGLSAARNAVARDAASNKDAEKAANAVYEGLGSADSYESAIPVDEEPVPEFKRGGMVRHMEEGGLLEEDPDMPFVDPKNPYVDPKLNVPVPTPAPRAVAPAPSAIPEAAPTMGTTAMGDMAPADAPVEAPAAQPKPESVQATVEGAQEATAAVAGELVADAGAPPAAVGPGSEEDRMDIVNNKGGLSNDEWKELVQTIDPNGSIPDYLKSAAVLSSTYKYFMENGQPEKAARIAKGILIANKQMTQTLGALAMNAMEDGDAESATQLVTDAANSFPSGQQFKVEVGENGLIYSVMENGKVVNQGELTTDQFWQLAGKVKDGSMYVEEMGRFAEAYSTNTASPEAALGAASDAYVSAMNAKTAFENAELDGVEGEELETLRAAARDAAGDYKQVFSQALKLGVKRTDIIATGKNALEMAIPDGEAAAAAEGGDEGGGFLGMIADGLTPSKWTEKPGVTPEGNTADYNSMPAPKSAEERDALPSGTQYIAPNGEVKVKK